MGLVIFILVLVPPKNLIPHPSLSNIQYLFKHEKVGHSFHSCISKKLESCEREQKGVDYKLISTCSIESYQHRYEQHIYEYLNPVVQTAFRGQAHCHKYYNTMIDIGDCLFLW